MSQDIEVFFPVRVVVRIVGSDTLAWEVLYSSLIEAGGKFIGLGLAFTCVGTPACGCVPAGVVSGGVDVDADEDDVGYGMPGRGRA